METCDGWKKTMKCCVAVILLFLAGIAAVYAEEAPQGIVKTFGAGTTLEDYIVIEDTPQGDYAFTITTENGERHVLTWFKQMGGAWKKLGSNRHILPDGAGMVFFRQHDTYVATGAYSNGEVQRFRDNWGFDIHRIDPKHEEYYMQTVGVHYIDGEFQIVEWQDRSRTTQRAYVDDGRICFYDPSTESRVSSVPLYAAFSLSSHFGALPKTYNAAKAEYNNPPKIPTGTLTAKRVKFERDEMFDVYQGPGLEYGQAGGGKARVSTNDWIQVFGRENGWVMIQYDISSDHMRIGWIPETALPQKAEISTFIWDVCDALVVKNATLTDDPLFSENAVTSLPASAAVRQLAEMGDWVYVEYTGEFGAIRGFVEADRIIAADNETIK